MALETTRWDITEFLDSDAAVAAYLHAVVEAGGADEMREALRHVARATAETTAPPARSRRPS
jgi:DNA-binding phage protein